MQQHKRSNNKKIPWWMCSLEEYYFGSPDWELVHDGQQNPGQFEFPPSEIRYFTRRYKCISEREGRFMGAWGATFSYDLRDGVVADVKFEFNREDSNHKKRKDIFALTQRKGGN